MKNLFTDHPASVGENYFEHLFTATRFSLGLLIAALARLVHAVLPFLFVKTGSQRVTTLYRHMVSQRDRRGRLVDGEVVE
ncbi:MAG: capsule biosynthesis protein [Gammaproteobacteria bacterium]|nr:capsule biosynthesis protein [Gammaproteobacteria bacterium]